MRMIIMGLGALIVLGGGAAGAYFYFMKPAEASAGEEVKAKAKDIKKEKHAKGGHGEQAAYVEVGPLILPIVDNDGVSQVLSVVVAIEVPDEKSKGSVEAQMPRLKDAFIQEMYGVLSKQAALKGGVVQVGYLKEKLNTVTAGVLEEDSFSDVLLQVIQQRPL